MPRIIKPAVGSFTASNITVDSSGRVVAATSGAGAANMVKTFEASTDGAATFTAQATTSKIHVYLKGAGGGGGGATSGEGKIGGLGGFGFFNIPVSQPYSVPFTLGNGGGGGTSALSPTNNGQAGTASSFNTNLVANGGGAGGTNTGSIGTTGTLANENYAYIDGNPYADASGVSVYAQGSSRIPTSGTDLVNYGSSIGTNLGDVRYRIGGIGGNGGSGPQNPAHYGGGTGQDGSVVVYEDIG
jgi:hypothetical protein